MKRALAVGDCVVHTDNEKGVTFRPYKGKPSPRFKKGEYGFYVVRYALCAVTFETEEEILAWIHEAPHINLHSIPDSANGRPTPSEGENRGSSP